MNSFSEEFKGIKISVIMLTYNRENLVERAIQSVLNQTFHDFEFIIVDNGSTDRSGVICDGYAAKDPRVRVIHRERGNIGSGRNAGLNAAMGEYIAFIDDDDYVEPDYLEFLFNLAVDNNADVAICGAVKEEDGKTVPVGVSDDVLVMNVEEAIITLLWRKRFNNGFPTKLFKSYLFNGLRFPEEGRYEDISLMYKVLISSEKTVSLGLPKYHVYRHTGNNSLATTKDGMITPGYLEAYFKEYRNRTNWLCERFPNKKDYWWYFDWSFQISMVNKIISNGLSNCSVHLDKMLNELTKNRTEFIYSPYILDFEKEWMKRYVQA